MIVRRFLPLSTAAVIAGLILAGAAPARATPLSCDIDLTIRNDGSYPVSVVLDHVQVRSRQTYVGWLPWRRASGGGWMANSPQPVHLLAPGQSLHDTYRPTGVCLGAREYRATVTCLEGPRTGQSGQLSLRVANSSGHNNRNIVLTTGTTCGFFQQPDSVTEGGAIPQAPGALPGIVSGN